VPLDALHILATNAAHLSDPGEFFRMARPLIARHTRADAVLIFYHDHVRECLAAPFLYNVMPHASMEQIQLSYDAAPIQDLLIRRKPHPAATTEPALLESMRSELYVPVLTPDQVLGCLYLGRSTSAVYTDVDIQLAELFSHCLIAPLQRIHWEEHSRHTHELLNGFREQYLYILDTIPFPALVVDPVRDLIEEANLALLQWLQYDRTSLFNTRFSTICPMVSSVQQQGNVWPPQAMDLQLRDARGAMISSRVFISPSSDTYKERKVLIFSPQDTAKPPVPGSVEGENHLYTLSHDLKTPIQSLKSYLALIREEYGHMIPGAALSYVQRMSVNLEQMEALITGVLELSRVGQIDSCMEWAHSADILKNALDSLSGLMEHRSVNLIIDANLPIIFCDAGQMTRVFTNLIANALKFTGSASMPGIEIGCNCREQEYEFYVKDNGVGIPEELHARIFDLFFSRDRVQEHKSTGIGLTIVKRIIERHHGRIWVESGVGAGTVIRFVLPTHPVQAEALLAHT
jgi:hypothetical protein